MRISTLKLSGMRCFDALELEFGPGVNLLSGRNGTGKTTVVDAIGVALFGVGSSRGDALERAIRDGSKELRIELTLHHAQREYRLTRTHRVGRRGPTSTATLFGDDVTPLADKPETVLAHLGELMSVADTASLVTIFNRLVGVGQGELTRPFLLASSEQMAHFSPLLNLDRYELAGRRTQAVGRELDRRAQLIDEERARFEGELKGYRAATERLTECQNQRDELAATLDRSQADSERLAAASAAYEERRQRIEQLRLEHAVALEAQRGRTAETARARALLEEAEAAATVIETTRADYERFEDLESELRAAELRRRELGDIRAEVEVLEQRLAEGRAEIVAGRELFETQLEMNQQDAEEMLAFRDVMRGHIDALRSRARRAEGAQSALAMAATRSEKLQRLIVGIESLATATDEEDEAGRREEEARRAEEIARAAADDAIAAEVAALRARAATLDSSRTRLREARESRVGLDEVEAALRATVKQLEPAHGACPILSEPCSNIGGKSLVDRFTAQLEEVAARRATADEEVRVAESRVLEAESARKLADEKEREREHGHRKKGSSRRGRSESSRPSPGASGRIVDFDDVAHHLSGLSGIIGALAPITTADAQKPLALIGAVAGEGDAGPVERDMSAIVLPNLDEIEAAQRIVHEGRAAVRANSDPDRQRELSARLAGLLRQIHAGIARAAAELSTALTGYREASRRGEAKLADSRKTLDQKSIERTRLRHEIKQLSSRDLGLLDTEIALSEKRMKLGGFERIESELSALRDEQNKLREPHDAFHAHALLAQRAGAFREEWEAADRQAEASSERWESMDLALTEALDGFDPHAGPRLQAEREDARRRQGDARASERSLEREVAVLKERIAEFADAREQFEELAARGDTIRRSRQLAGELEEMYRAMAGPVAAVVNETLVNEANRLYRRVSGRAAELTWRESSGLELHEAGGVRTFAELAHGDQTAAAIAMTLALLRQFPQIGLLCLDEPTAHLDVARRHALAEALSRFRDASADYVEQMIVISHDDAFSHVADRHIALD